MTLNTSEVADLAPAAPAAAAAPEAAPSATVAEAPALFNTLPLDAKLLRAIEVDFADVLAKKNATVSVRQIIRELEAAQEPLWSPMVLNGSGYGVLANHSLVLAGYRFYTTPNKGFAPRLVWRAWTEPDPLPELADTLGRFTDTWAPGAIAHANGRHNTRSFRWFMPAITEVERCVAISTQASIRRMVAPGVLALVSPVIVGFWSRFALGGLLARVCFRRPWLVEARDGGSCIVRLVNTGFGTGDDWDAQYDGMADGWQLFLLNLQLHLRHFRGRHGRSMLPMGVLPGPREAAWHTLLAALGLPGSLSVGERVSTAGSGAPALAGTVVRADSWRLALLVDEPAPGTAFAREMMTRLSARRGQLRGHGHGRLMLK